MDKRTLIVNLFGGPGVGKSSTAAGIFSLLKLHSVECELVTEFAKDLVWEERYKTFGDQQYIFGKQHHRIWRLRDKVDVIITDSPIMLSAVYRQETLSQSFVDSVVETTNSYNNYNVILTRAKKYNPNGRNETEEQAKDLDRKIKTVLGSEHMFWEEVPGNYEGINIITEKILKKLGGELKFKINL